MCNIIYFLVFIKNQDRWIQNRQGEETWWLSLPNNESKLIKGHTSTFNIFEIKAKYGASQSPTPFLWPCFASPWAIGKFGVDLISPLRWRYIFHRIIVLGKFYCDLQRSRRVRKYTQNTSHLLFARTLYICKISLVLRYQPESFHKSTLVLN